MEPAVRLMTQFFGALFLSVFISSATPAMESTRYLPADADLDTSIPSPESVLGWEVGDWRIHHPALVQYMQKLAASSDRVSIKVTGYTHEQRPLLQMVISSAENQSRLESLRQAHLQGAVTGNPDAPLVVWLVWMIEP